MMETSLPYVIPDISEASLGARRYTRAGTFLDRRTNHNYEPGCGIHILWIRSNQITIPINTAKLLSIFAGEVAMALEKRRGCSNLLSGIQNLDTKKGKNKV